MNIEKIWYKDQHRIRLGFKFDANIAAQIKTFNGATYSGYLKAWHLPYSNDNWAKLKTMFCEATFVINEKLCDTPASANKMPQIPQQATATEWAPNGISIKYNHNYIYLKMPPNPTDLDFVRQLNRRRWDKAHNLWVIPNNEGHLNKVKAWFNERLTSCEDLSISYPKITIRHEGNKQSEVLGTKTVANPTELEQFKKWMEHKRYSEATINNYMYALTQFLRHISPKTCYEVTNNDMVQYVNQVLIPAKMSHSYQNILVNATRLFFKNLVGSKVITEQIDRPRQEHKLPNVLSRNDVRQIFEATPNLKHRAMLSLIYACGLRRSELLNLKITDIDSDRHFVTIYNAKGKKDRLVPISDKTLNLLREYFRQYRPKDYLFEGQNHSRYSEASLQKIFKTAVRKVRIKKEASLHWLRHSYATHLMESGTDLRYIQELLGHKNSRTTEIYTHVSQKSLLKIKSPFDDLDDV